MSTLLDLFPSLFFAAVLVCLLQRDVAVDLVVGVAGETCHPGSSAGELRLIILCSSAIVKFMVLGCWKKREEQMCDRDVN